MVLFQYVALTETGKKNIGLINADTLQDAKEKLRTQKVFVTKLSLYNKQRDRFSLPSPLVLQCTRDMYVLLRAGLPLYDALLTLEEKYRRHKAHFLFLDLCDQVREGKALSLALEAYPKIFNPIYLSIVKAGEESGTLDKSFKKLSELLEKSHAFRKKIVSAMIYPAFLGIFCFILLSFLLFFLIPSMQDLFEDRSLHPLTRTILSVSTFLNSHYLLFFSSLFVFFFLFSCFLRHKQGKMLLQRLFLHLPIVSRLIIQSILTRFCQVLSSLLGAGLSLIEALKLSKAVMHNHIFERAIMHAEKGIMEGRKLSEELQATLLVPNLIVRMVAIGEESGDMARMVGHVAAIYEEEVERSLSRLTTLLQPLTLLFLGFIVAIILLAVLLPLTDVSSIVR